MIAKAEAFLAGHPKTDFRKQVLYALAVANESWWSIAHSPADDQWVSGIPYPRSAANAQQAGRARDEAIRYYREVVALAPGSAEAASAVRRLPRAPGQRKRAECEAGAKHYPWKGLFHFFPRQEGQRPNISSQ